MLSAEKGTYWVPEKRNGIDNSTHLKWLEKNLIRVISATFTIKKIIANESIMLYNRLKS
jgi:hypothetical protein